MAKKKGNDDLDFFSSLAKSCGGETLEEIGSEDRGFIDTGVLGVNYLMSGKFIAGGVPVGTLVELYGPSSSGKSLLAMNIMKGTQKAGGVAVYLDAERAVNKDFALKASKVDPSKMIVLYPDTLKNAFYKINSVITKIRANEKYKDKPIVIVYDSIAVSPSDEEFAETTVDMENDSEAAIKAAGARLTEQPGARARICSKELRKLMFVVAENNASVIFINQLRMKIGVLYGCLHYRSKIMLADGTWRKIGTIVNNKEPLEVLSWNQKTGEISPKKIIDWHINGEVPSNENWLRIIFSKHFDSHVGSTTLTPNHIVFIKKNNETIEIQARDLKVGDIIVSPTKITLSDQERQFVYGSILGDGNLRRDKDRHSASLRLAHSRKQDCYLEQKYKWFKKFPSEIKYEKRKCYLDSHALSELRNLSDYVKSKIIPQEIIDKLDVFGLAIWYMDDGNYSGHYDKYGSGKSIIYCSKFKNKEKMLGSLERLGLKATLSKRGFSFDSDNTDKLHQMICGFIPECMQYKLHPKYRGLFSFDEIPSLDKEYWKEDEGQILKIEKFQDSIQRNKFDITIEDNHTYITNGMVVHNSPMTTAGGGEALQYYCSTRLELKSKKEIKTKGSDVVQGINTDFFLKKSRFNKPRQTASEIGLLFDSGIDPFGGMLGALLNAERIEQTGKGIYSIKEPWADGKEVKFSATKEANRVPVDVLLDNPKLVDATSKEEVQYYIDLYSAAIGASDSEKYEQVAISANDIE